MFESVRAAWVRAWPSLPRKSGETRPGGFGVALSSRLMALRLRVKEPRDSWLWVRACGAAAPPLEVRPFGLSGGQ